MSLAILTRGMLQFGRGGTGGTTTVERPQTTSVQEVRPRTRRVSAPPAASLTPPVSLSAKETRPTTARVVGPSTPSVGKRPSSLAAKEMRPATKKVEKV